MENPNASHTKSEEILPGQATDLAMAPVGPETKECESVGFEERILLGVLAHAEEALVVCDTSGNIIRASHAVNRYYHLQCLNRPFDEIFHLSLPHGMKQPSAGSSANLSRKYLSRILAGESLHNEAVCLTTEDGTFAEVLFGAHPLQDEHQRVIGAIMTFGDSGPLLHSEYILKRHNDVLENIIAGNPLSIILEKLCLEIEQYFKAGVRASILLLEDGCRLCHAASPSLPESYSQAINGLEIGPEVGSCGAAAYLKEPVYVANISEHPNWVHFKELAGRHGIQACWSTPILASDGHVLGTFALYAPVLRLPSTEEKEYLEFLAHSASIAIEKVQAQERLLQQKHALEVVNRIGSSLAAELNLEKLVQSVTDACRELTGAEFGAFFYNMVNEKGESYALYTISGVPREAFDGFPMPRNTPIFAPTFSGDEVVRIADVTADPRYGQMPPYHGMPPGHLPVKSYLAVPVVSRSGEVLGGLFFGHSQPNMFTQTGEAILIGIASQAAIAIDNARLYQSAQKEIEQRKHVSENLRRLASIVESSQDAIYSLNRAGMITSWNNGAEKMYGYAASEIVDQSFSILLPPESRQDIFSDLAFLLNQTGATLQESLRMKREGVVFPVSLTISPILDVDGNLIGHSLIERDISEQKRIGEALRSSESRHQAIWENSPTAKFVKDLNGTYQLINKRIETIFQMPREAILGKTDYELMNPADARRLRANDQEILDSRTPKEFEEQIELPDGVHTYLSVKFPLYDAQGIPHAICGIATDITARKQAEQALQELNDSLEQRVSDRTRDLLVYQENLRAMTSELVVTEQRERRRLSTELHDYLAQLLVVCRMKLAQALNEWSMPALKTNLDEIDQILSDSLSYTRTLIAELSPSILYELGLVPALKWLGQQMERHDLRVQVQHGDQAIELSEDQAIFVFQAVRELLFNIIKHSGVSEALVSLKRTASQELHVKVEDAGKGFHPSPISTDYSKPGRFGLFSIRERTEALGGHFYIESAPGKGTQATLVVPLQPVSPTVASNSDSKGIPKPLDPIAQGGSRKKVVRILLVDDHAMIREGIRTLLENHEDFVIVGEAKNGEEAIAVAQLVLPDVVIMDVNMPKMNGIEATKWLTRKHPSIRVIGLSVHEDKQIEKMLLEAGAATYVTKGSVASQLVEAIRQVVNQIS
ncbi:PAS domain-containing protein [Candidatus Nitrospira neomarina]|uniref:PAS domain S-box protein n=1 Tax=Candidatus Nitrospira neomarina TaxID=3020899 RepID=A0AA96GPM6_9BACT|nr:PAS domain-containing protein [Candidatus Nitrospira neomarina]WNM64070.1 PAS domain S-box protein [Candidatus Nitrospira neomarina]